MIIREAVFDNAWYRAAGAWFIALSAINCLIWPTWDYYGYNLSELSWLAFSIPGGTLLLWMTGRLFFDPRRVWIFVTVVGLFGFLPLLIGLILPVILLLAFAQVVTVWSFVAMVSCLIFGMYWIFIEVRTLRASVICRRFIEREFTIEATCICLNRNATTELDAPHRVEGTFLGKLERTFPKFALLLTVAYPLQRLFFDTGGIPGTCLLLSILGTPLAIYVLGRIACGFYLWVYTVRKLESQHGKPVILGSTAGKI